MATSTVLVIPAAHQGAGNSFFCAIGEDALPGYTFTRQLSADGELPVTHYACHTMASDALLTTLTDVRIGEMGSKVPVGVDWTDWDTTEPAVLSFGEGLSIHMQGEPQIEALPFFENVLSGLNLVAIPEVV